MADDHFEIRKEARPLIPTWQASISAAGIEMALALMEAGQTPSEACSVIAHMLIRSAWSIAGSGAIEEGKRPRPAYARLALENAIKSVEFYDAERSRVELDEDAKPPADQPAGTMEADSRRFVDLRSGETGLLVIDGNGEIISGPALDQRLDEFHAARRPPGDLIEDKSNG